MIRRFALAAAALAALTVCPAAASAEEAQFSVSLSGHYATSGTVTDSRCQREDENGNVTRFTATGNASETTSFNSKRAGSLTFAQFSGGPIDSGGVVPLVATMTRTGDLDGEGPPGCTSGSMAPQGCGTLHKNYRSGFGTSGRRPVFESYHVVGPAADQAPGDPFPGCKLVLFDDPWVSVDPGRARLPVRQVFNPRVRKIVLHGLVSKVFDKTDQELSMHVGEKLSWTLTLRRRGA